MSRNLCMQNERLNLEAIMDKSDLTISSSAFFKKGSKSTGFWGGIKQAIGSLTSTKDSFDGVDYSHRPRLEIRNAQLPTEDIIMNNMDYSKNSGMVLPNIKPDSSGVLHIPLENLRGYGFYALILCDLHSTLVVEFHENGGQILKKDMRPQEIMKPREILQVNYTVHASDQAHKVEVAGVQSAQSAVIEDLESLREALLCLATPDIDKQELGEWTFLTKWANLTDEEKESKWDKYGAIQSQSIKIMLLVNGGHELSVFTFLRDQKFFLNYIQPLLRSKAQQSFIDKLLSAYDKNLDPKLDWAEIAGFNKISTFSAVEILLLLLLSPKDANDLRKNILFYVESQVNSQATDNSLVKNVWESLLNRSTNPSEALDESESSKSTNKKSVIVDSPKLRSSVDPSGPPQPVIMDCLMDLGGEIATSGKRAMVKQSAQEVLLSSKQEMPLGDPAYDPGFVKIEEVDNPVILEEYHKAPLANEFKERQEHFVGEYSEIPFNKQWLKIYQHIAAKRNEGKSPSELLDPQTWVFVSEELLFMKNSTAEVVAALTIAPLGANKAKVTPVEVSSTSLKYRGAQPYFVLVKSSKIDSSSEPLELDIVVAQKFYDPQDKHIYDEKDPKIFTIKEISEFLTAKIYESRVSVSNLSESSATLDLHTQVPQGALAVYQLDDFSTSSKTIDPMQTKMYTFKFYFPAVGEYKVYPATVTQNNRFVTCAKLAKDSLLGSPEFKLKVVDDYRPIFTPGVVSNTPFPIVFKP